MARYIDADLLIENIAKIDDLRTLSTKTIGEAISNTPTADVEEVKHGKWERPTASLSRFADRYVICSECNVMLPTTTELPEFWYCPNCGAKMEGGNG